MWGQIDWVLSEPLQDGLMGVHQTLGRMAALVRKDAQSLVLRDKAIQIIQHCGGHEFNCEIDALFRFCRDQIVYRRDPVEQERVADCERTLASGVADCDDKCVCLATLLATVGHKTRFKVLGQRRGNYSHVYLEVQRKDGSWLPLDPTPEQAHAGWEARGHAATYEIFTNDVSPIFLIGAGLLLYWLLR